jgi:hypothetical protein
VDEQQALLGVAHGAPPDDLKDALGRLEQFGLIRTESASTRVSSALLWSWIENCDPLPDQPRQRVGKGLARFKL